MKTKFSLLALLLLGSNAIVFAQNKDKEIKEKANVETEELELTISADDRIYVIVEENAQFPGGNTELAKWLGEHIQYPAEAKKQGIQGRVIVDFVVNKDGSIIEVKTIRSPDPSLTKEAERVVKMMPKWKPARQNNKVVRSHFTLPIMFRF